MKICRNELLLLGGLYQVTAFILALTNSSVAYATIGVLYLLFWLAVLALSLNFVSAWKFVYHLNENLPRLSVFLASVGWIPYFTIIYVLTSVGVDYFSNGADNLTLFLDKYIPVYDVYMAAIGLSILYAAYKVFFKKEDLVMSCAAQN
jgi:hypothetical protein